MKKKNLKKELKQLKKENKFLKEQVKRLTKVNVGLIYKQLERLVTEDV